MLMSLGMMKSMARAKKAIHVWQCSICGYWSERRGNVNRHNNSWHMGSAFIAPAVAMLVVEPSYKIMPSTAYSSSLAPPSYPVVAFDTRVSRGKHNTGTSTGEDGIENAFIGSIDAATSQIEENLKPLRRVEKFIEKLKNLKIWWARLRTMLIILIIHLSDIYDGNCSKYFSKSL
jgi:hypothetical protein